MFWKKKIPDASTSEQNAAHQLYEYLCEAVKKDGRIRVEDLITAVASVIAELCIETAGHFNPRQHQFVPGSRVFSTQVNKIFCGDQNLESAPKGTIVGMLRDRLLAAGYNLSDFPALETVFSYYAANIGKASDWGKVPLSIPPDNYPFVLPLQVAYETRPAVDRIFHALTTPQVKLRASVLTLAEALIAVRQAIDKKIGLTLALETINGMAKTAPMTDEAMAAAMQNNTRLR